MSWEKISNIIILLQQSGVIRGNAVDGGCLKRRSMKQKCMSVGGWSLETFSFKGQNVHSSFILMQNKRVVQCFDCLIIQMYTIQTVNRLYCITNPFASLSFLTCHLLTGVTIKGLRTEFLHSTPVHAYFPCIGLALLNFKSHYHCF